MCVHDDSSLIEETKFMRYNSGKEKRKEERKGGKPRPNIVVAGKWLCNGRAFSFEGACMLAFPLTNLRDGH